MRKTIMGILAALTVAFLTSGCTTGGELDEDMNEYAFSLSTTEDTAVTFVPPGTGLENSGAYIEAYPKHGQVAGSVGSVVYTPEAKYSGTDTFTVVFRVQSSDANATVVDGVSARYIVTVTVNGINDGPTITGTPPSLATVGSKWSYNPVITDSDTPSSSLKVTVQGAASWMNYNSSTFALSGTPSASDADTYTEISYIVSDGEFVVESGPHSVSVGPATENSAPTIAGTPSTSVEVDTAYSFTPVASDPDGDTLTFSIANPPSWATFSSTTGKLSGTPTTVNDYLEITIEVSDGNGAVSSLPAFDISVTP